MIKSIITNPFAVLVFCLILGSFFVFNNDIVSDGSTPIFFHGHWAILVGTSIYAVGVGYLTYSIYKTTKK